MTTQNLTSVAVHVMGQYNKTGKTFVSAYRSGAHRMLGGVVSRFSGVQKVTDFLGNRLDIDTSRVVNLMDRVTAVSTNGIGAISDRAAKIESPVAISLMNTVSALNMPMAQLSAQIADKFAEGAKAIEVRVAGDKAPVKAVVAKAKKVRRAVRKAA